MRRGEGHCGSVTDWISDFLKPPHQLAILSQYGQSAILTWHLAALLFSCDGKESDNIHTDSRDDIISD